MLTGGLTVMKIKIKTFSLYRDLLEGRKEIEVVIDKNSEKLENILVELSAKYPRLKKFLSNPENNDLLLVLVNGEKKSIKDTVLYDGDEVGLMVPPSGG